MYSADLPFINVIDSRAVDTAYVCKRKLNLRQEVLRKAR